MKQLFLTLAVTSLLIGPWSGCTPANAQVPGISISGGKTYLAGEIRLSATISTMHIRAFWCSPVKPLKKGDNVPAQVSDDQGWSVDTGQLKVNGIGVDYPILAFAAHHTIYPAVLHLKVNLTAGQVIHSQGWEIHAKRSVKAGASISVLNIGGTSVLSAEASTKNSSHGTEPWFTAYKQGVKRSERTAAVKARRVVNNHVGG